MPVKNKIYPKSTKSAQEYRMPDGTWTKDALKMSRAWKKIYATIEKKFALTCIGFDPGILFKRNGGGNSFDIPTDVAIRIKDLIEENKSLESQVDGG